MKSNLVIWCLGFAALWGTCSAGAGQVLNATSPEVHHKTNAVQARPTVHDIKRHERRKKEKEKRKRKVAPKAPGSADAANITDIVKTADVLVKPFDDIAVTCAFANPTFEQAKTLLGLGLFDTFKAAVEYAELTNVPFSAALGKWLSKNITVEGLYDEGFAMGEIHRVWFSSTVPTDNRTEVICKMESALYSQMKNTCRFRDWEKDLITVSVAIMEGFAHAVDHSSFAGCTE